MVLRDLRVTGCSCRTMPLRLVRVVCDSPAVTLEPSEAIDEARERAAFCSAYGVGARGARRCWRCAPSTSTGGPVA